MQVNSIKSNQSFGMAIRVNDNAVKALSEKLCSGNDIEKFQKLISSQRKNPFHVIIFKSGYPNTLCGCVADYSTYFKKHKKGLFQTPIQWIENMCKDADRQLEKANLYESLNNIIKE